MRCTKQVRLLFILFLVSSQVTACATMSPLSKAARDGNMNKINDLISSGGNINERDPIWGWSSLQYAVYYNQTEAVRLLIEKGANLNIADENGRTPLLLAVEYNYKDIIHILLDKGADMNIRDKEGYSPLIRAVYYGYFDIAKIFIERGADVNIADAQGYTPLVLAIHYNNKDMVNFLLEKGADIEIPDMNGSTPLMHASIYGCTEIAELLIEEGADIDTADQHGSTALIQAVNNGNIEIAELLIEEAADVIAVDSYGYKAHDYVKFSQKPFRKIFKAADHERRESLLKLLKDNETRQILEEPYKTKYALRAKVSPILRKVQQCMAPERDYDIFINNREQPSVKVNLSGTITYSKGAVEKWDEDTLLVATAHEIAHDKLNHAEKNTAEYIGIVAVGAGVMVTSAVLVPPLGLLYMIMTPFVQSAKAASFDNDKKKEGKIDPLRFGNYSQSQEQEADQVATESCGRCFGMTKEKLSETLRSMKEKSKTEGGGFRSAHPWINRLERTRE
jgi:ankyrin repeat protein